MPAVAEEVLGVEHYIILTPDPRLREYWPEADFDTSFETLARMYDMSKKGATDGRGLAGLSSVQVTLPGRVITAADGMLNEWVGLIDPVIVRRSYEVNVMREGCFSLDRDLFVPVQRHLSIDVAHTTHEGREVTTLTSFQARYAQHEIDHINGVLMTDYQGGQ